MAFTSTAAFLDDMRRRGYDARLRKLTGTAELEVVDADGVERWLLRFEQGRLSVSPAEPGADADAVLRVERAPLERIVAGRMNLMAAVLRGAVQIEGDVRLLVLLQRLFPRPSPRSPGRAGSGGGEGS